MTEESSFINPERLAGIHVLVVDHNPDTCELFRIILESAGAGVTTAVSVAQALAVLRDERPDVLLSEIVMPEEDGRILIRDVRYLPAHLGGETPAAAITGLTRAKDRAEILKAGYQHHIPQPVDRLNLVGIVALLATK
jgi:CheY-like chemotaxis protein